MQVNRRNREMWVLLKFLGFSVQGFSLLRVGNRLFTLDHLDSLALIFPALVTGVAAYTFIFLQSSARYIWNEGTQRLSVFSLMIPFLLLSIAACGYTTFTELSKELLPGTFGANTICGTLTVFFVVLPAVTQWLITDDEEMETPASAETPASEDLTNTVDSGVIVLRKKSRVQKAPAQEWGWSRGNNSTRQ
jgi:hypothetical protein